VISILKLLVRVLCAAMLLSAIVYAANAPTERPGFSFAAEYAPGRINGSYARWRIADGPR